MTDIDAYDLYRRHQLLKAAILVDEAGNIAGRYTEILKHLGLSKHYILKTDEENLNFYIDRFTALQKPYIIPSDLSLEVILHQLKTKADLSEAENKIRAAYEPLAGLFAMLGIEILPEASAKNVDRFAQAHFGDITDYSDPMSLEDSKITIDGTYVRHLNRFSLLALTEIASDVYNLRANSFGEMQEDYARNINWSNGRFSLNSLIETISSTEIKPEGERVHVGPWNVHQSFYNFIKASAGLYAMCNPESEANLLKLGKKQVPLSNIQILDDLKKGIASEEKVSLPDIVPKASFEYIRSGIFGFYKLDF